MEKIFIGVHANILEVIFEACFSFSNLILSTLVSDRPTLFELSLAKTANEV